MSNSVEYENLAKMTMVEIMNHMNDLEKSLWCCSSEGVSLVGQLKEKDEEFAALNLRLELAEFEARMFRKYKHLDLEKLETDYDYYDCVFMEHFEMNYHNDETTEKHRLEGVEFMKMFKKPVDDLTW